MQPIPTHSSPLQLNDTHTKVNLQSPIIFRPYNHYPLAPTFNALDTTEPRRSAFKRVVSKRSNTADIPSDIPLKLCRTKSHQYNSHNLSKLIPSINGNCSGDDSRNDEPNGIFPLNLKMNTINRHETVTHSTCDNYEMAYDLTTHPQQQQQPKINNVYQSDANSHKQQIIQYQYTAKGNFIFKKKHILFDSSLSLKRGRKKSTNKLNNVALFSPPI